MRARLEYEDQNEDFACHLPVTGRLSRQVPGSDGRQWWIMTLDAPLEYQHKVGEPFQYRLVRTTELVLGNRWPDQVIGERAPAPVHILVPLEAAATRGDSVRLDAFAQVAWGVVSIAGAA